MVSNVHFNKRITYHSFLTPQHLARDSLFSNPKFDVLLSNIERTANCIIKTRPMVQSDVNDGNFKISGYWLTEIYYHQLYGKHDLAMRMIDAVLKDLSQVNSYSQHRVALRTIRGFFQIEDREIINKLDNTDEYQKIEEIRSTDYELLDNETAYPLMKHINSAVDVRVVNENAEKTLMNAERDSISQ